MPRFVSQVVEFNFRTQTFMSTLDPLAWVSLRPRHRFAPRRRREVKHTPRRLTLAAERAMAATGSRATIPQCPIRVSLNDEDDNESDLSRLRRSQLTIDHLTSSSPAGDGAHASWPDAESEVLLPAHPALFQGKPNCSTSDSRSPASAPEGAPHASCPSAAASSPRCCRRMRKATRCVISSIGTRSVGKNQAAPNCPASRPALFAW